MTESTHDLIATKAARLRELLRLAEVGSSDTGDGTSGRAAANSDGTGYGPTWSGGGWAN